MESNPSYLVSSSEDKSNTFTEEWFGMASHEVFEDERTLTPLNLDDLDHSGTNQEQPQSSSSYSMGEVLPTFSREEILQLSFHSNGYATTNSNEIIQVDSSDCRTFLDKLSIKDRLMDIGTALQDPTSPAVQVSSSPTIQVPSSPTVQVPSSPTVQVPSSPAPVYMRSCLPASQNWPGGYNFKVSFNTDREKKTKGITWTYLNDKNKLYVGREVPCPISFSTQCNMPKGLKIRVTALYSSPESASERVERCINHIQDDISKNIIEPEHLVRCESPTAVYEVDPITNHYSVVIPFENPPLGQSYSTYIYKFVCFGSCSGPSGPNRRPLMLVFSLEKDNMCVGRQRVDIKICACPGRDSLTEERGTVSKKRKMKTEPETPRTNSTELPGTSSPPMSKRAKEESSEVAPYNIAVYDYKMYQFLEQMKNFYILMKNIKNLPPPLKNMVDKYNERHGFRFPDFI